MRPLRPFPFPLNVGTDICQISRIYNILRGPQGGRFVKRVLAPEELSRAAELQRWIGEKPKGSAIGYDQTEEQPELWKKATFVAGRFAAKEAAMKAHTHRRLTFHDIIIERRGRDEERLGSGPPVARIVGQSSVDEEDMSAMISISHDGDYATAVCMGYDPSVVEKGQE